MSLPCRFNPATGKVVNFSGQEVDDCAGCSCQTKGFVLTSGIIGNELNFRVTNIGCDFRLEWDCPDCGVTTHEDCTPLDAIPLSEEIRSDALCCSCRGKRNG